MALSWARLRFLLIRLRLGACGEDAAVEVTLSPSVCDFRGYVLSICLITVVLTLITWLRWCPPGFSIVKLTFPPFGINKNLGGMYFETMRIPCSFSNPSPPVLRQMNALSMPFVAPFIRWSWLPSAVLLSGMECNFQPSLAGSWHSFQAIELGLS